MVPVPAEYVMVDQHQTHHQSHDQRSSVTVTSVDYSSCDSGAKHPHEQQQQQQESNECDKSIAKGGVTVPFPWKLHNMLDAMDSEGDHSVVQWQSHGRSFMVHDPKLFVVDIMPRFFNQTKYASFQRQLNLYGFRRLSHGKDKGAYYHPCFVRGQNELCRQMVRQKIKGNKVRKTLAPEEEPDFYVDNWKERLERAIEASNASSISHEDWMSSERRASFTATRRPSTTSSRNSNGQNKHSKQYQKQDKASIPKVVSTQSDSLVSMMRNAGTPSNGAITTLVPPPPVLHQISQVSSCNSLNVFDTTPSSSVVSLTSSSFETYRQIQAGDLLFFEGQPFRYLDHVDVLPQTV